MRGAVKGASLAAIAAAVAVLVSLAANAATSRERWPGVLDRVRQQPWWWVAGLAAVGVLVAVVVAWRQERTSTVATDPPPPPQHPVPDWVVDRAERARTVKAVCRTGRGRGSRTVAITTSLEGAGGFGKTVLAGAVAASPRVRRHFRGRTYTVTIGRDVRGRAAVAAKVAEATRFITGDTTTFDDPGLAGDHLGRLLDSRPPTLLVLDDVWDAEQLDPFLRGGARCVRLVTTRVPGALPRGTERVRVDQMSPAQARAVLTRELPALPETLVRDLLEATGRWALLLRLTNRLITRRIATGTDPAAAAADALRGLAANGPAIVDADSAPLDLDDPARRALAVRATVEAATTLLPTGGDRRLAELAVFAEDESIPVPLIARLWSETGGLDESETRALCGELDRLSLVSLSSDHGGRITLHDVLRDYLQKELGEPTVTALHGTLADAVGPTPWAPAEDIRGYVLDHAVEHLLAAGRRQEAQRVASDLRWIETRLHQRGPLAAWADLAAVPTRTAAHLADDLTRTAHLLTPTDPPELLTNVLHSRLESLPLWRDRIDERRADPGLGPHLRNRRTPPDLPEPALIRTFFGHNGPVWAVAVSPAGDALVTIGADGMARGLDPNSGGRLAVDVRGQGRFRSLAMSPDGTWLATAGSGRTVHLWSLDRATMPTKTLGPVGEEGASVHALAITPDGTRVVTVSDRHVELWDAVGGVRLAEARRISSAAATCLAVAPDTTLLALGGWAGARRMSGDLSSYLPARGGRAGRQVNALAYGPDGGWSVAAWDDGTLHLWDESGPQGSGATTTIDDAHSGAATAVAVSPDGRWLASGGEDGTLAVWNRALRTCRARYSAHQGGVHAVAFTPDGDRLISAGEDGSVKIWDRSGPERFRSGEGEGMRTVTALGHGGLLAVAHRDGVTRLGDPLGDTWRSPLSSGNGDDYRGPVAFGANGGWYAAGHLFRVEIGSVEGSPGASPVVLRLGHTVSAQALAVAPDDSWIAVADSDGALQLWDRSTERRTALLARPPGTVGRAQTVAIAPDGTWLAVLRHRSGSGPAGAESSVHVFRLAPGRRSAEGHLDLPHDGRITALAVTHDGTRLLTTSTTGALTHWDPRTGEPLATHTDPDGPVNGLSVSPDGKWIAIAGTMLRVLDAATGRTVAAVRAETPYTSCTWLPDGRGLVAVGERGLYSYEFLT
ncbi:NB-ARC domain-containing protein [Streptomyces sp. NPDC046712]|uniref:NB-ARC domain-containing protein n=1 Tax=Streptomyces sp. NPDC046712 TaxID=3154802 RepID=UPI0033C6B82F